MASNSSHGDDLVLASGVVYFSENFQALPHVVAALTTRASTTETLKADAITVDRTLARLLDKGSDSLLTSTALLSAVSTEFEESRARVRDLKRRVEASLASLSGRRRDLNGLAFRQQQVGAALGVLESIEICLKACQGPLNIPVCNEAKTLEIAFDVYKSKLGGRLSDETGQQLLAKLEDRKRAICKLLRAQVLDSVSGRGVQDKDLIRTLSHLKNLGGLDETVTDALRVEYKLPSPDWRKVIEDSFTPKLPLVTCEFLSFPPIESIENVAHFTASLIEWGNLLMERSNQFHAALKLVSPGTKLGIDETWKYVQASIEKLIRPLLDAFARPTTSVVSNSEEDRGARSSRPKFYTRKRGPQHSLQPSDDISAQSLPNLSTIEEVNEVGLVASPYHLAFISSPLLAFVRVHDPVMTGRLASFIKHCCETSLRSVVNRDSAALFKISSSSQSSDFLRSCLRLQNLVLELREKVLSKIEMSDSRQLLLDVCSPFIHACRQRIDSAVDRPVSAWLAEGGSKLAQQLKSDPLFLAMEARRTKGDIPQRSLLLEAAFENFKQTLSTSNLTKETSRVPNSDFAVLAVLSSCLHRVADLMGAEAVEERLDIASSADYALFAARVDILLKVDLALKEFLSETTTFGDMVAKITRCVRLAHSLMDDWTENPAVLDFVFLPAAMRVAQSVASFFVQAKQDQLRAITQEQLFALHSAFASTLVRLTSDPWSDLMIFRALQHALRLLQTWPDNITLRQAFVSDAIVKERHKELLIATPLWHLLFSQENVLRM